VLVEARLLQLKKTNKWTS